MTYHPDRWQPVIDAVNERLEALGWDQATFMRRADLSDASVRPFMTGKFRSNPRRVTVMKVEDALGWQRGSVDDIIAGLQPTLVATANPDDITQLRAEMAALRRVVVTLGDHVEMDVRDLLGPNDDEPVEAQADPPGH